MATPVGEQASKSTLPSRFRSSSLDDEQRVTRRQQLNSKPQRDLVCQRCWDNIFTSNHFAKVCRGDKDSDGEYLRYEYDIPYGHLQESEAVCNWCRVIHLCISRYLRESEPSLELSSLSLSYNVRIRFTTYGYKGDDNIYLELNASGESCYGIQTWAHPDDVAFDFVKAHPYKHEVNTEEGFNEARAWIRDCAFHEHCLEERDMELPTRVIEVSPEDHPGQPRLLLAGGRTGRYAVLSYCWGRDPTGVPTLLANLESRLNSINVDDLSRSIQDAIFWARQLGLQYLWTDALCIIQDSEGDKAHESANMGRIYQQAHVTIVAASASAAKDGFLGDRLAPESFSVPFPFPCPNHEMGTLFLVLEARYFPQAEPVNQRGWTLQEWYLSPRRLVNGSRELVYDYQTVALTWGSTQHPRYLSLPSRYLSPPEENVPLTSGRTQEGLDDWIMAVKEFSGRKLSHSDDRVIAIGSIAELFSSWLGDYACGLWKVELATQLF
ncbi:HET-domain-containing protein [Lophium mytilinum]|uniref:HET-domain-containing protein n=1 Tax=Lophium mytilinum TaxID=390894 RepID=A0A6A6QI38_9PEZI|nr:HET-domain-containing protein [Lophium mytilinum]